MVAATRTRRRPGVRSAVARESRSRVGGRDCRVRSGGFGVFIRALAVAMRVGDRGSGRSGAIGEAADMTISDQPSVTVTVPNYSQNEPSAL